MAKPGPAKTPTNIIKLRNNPGKRPINEDEPKFDGEAEPSRQVLANETALTIWKSKSPELIDKGLLTFQDSDAFSTYCLLRAKWRSVWEQIEKLGDELAIAKGLMKALLAVDVRCDRWGAKFGLSPSDRTGIKATPKESPHSAKRFLA